MPVRNTGMNKALTLNPNLHLLPEKGHAYGTKTLTYLIKFLNLCFDIKNRERIVGHLQTLSNKQFIFFASAFKTMTRRARRL